MGHELGYLTLTTTGGLVQGHPRGEWRIEGNTLHFLDDADPDRVVFSYTFHFDNEEQLTMVRSVKVRWREMPYRRPAEDDEPPWQASVCTLDAHADERNTSMDNISDLKKMIANACGVLQDANRIEIDAVTNVCNCHPHPSRCAYEEKFKGRRFVVEKGTRIGHVSIFENIPNPADGYPDRRITVENVRKDYVTGVLAVIVEQEGHR
ncbi:hypothetical protein AB0E06_23455 [Streptomyces sp. NPDC048109]|uniref:hypothetical protein n=1 Tax=unclassified Streptomyces TaxID=2593676 RepID=UPI0033DF630A